MEQNFEGKIFNIETTIEKTFTLEFDPYLRGKKYLVNCLFVNVFKSYKQSLRKRGPEKSNLIKQVGKRAIEVVEIYRELDNGF